MIAGWVVRVVLNAKLAQDRALLSGPVIDLLRVSGAIAVHRNDGESACFDLLPPARVNDVAVPWAFGLPEFGGLGPKVWAERTAEAWTQRGFNAVCAPEWREA